MTHEQAREAMEALLAAPADHAQADGATAVAQLEAHLAGCAACAREYRGQRMTAAALQLEIGPPAMARARVLAGVIREGRPRGTVYGAAGVAAAPPEATLRAPRRGLLLTLPRALAAAAVLAVLAFVGGALSVIYLGPREGDGALAKAAMMMADIARDPQAVTMTLHDPSGAPGGTVMFAPDSRMLVVFSESLPGAASGDYDCYVERAGERTWVGPMLFEADTAFWAGPVRASDLGQPGDRFLVLADEGDPTPMLEATF